MVNDALSWFRSGAIHRLLPGLPIIVVAACSFSAVSFDPRQAQEGATRFLSALERRDPGAAYAASSDESQHRQTLDTVRRAFEAAGPPYLVDFTFTSQPVPVNGSSSRLSQPVHLAYGDGSAHDVKLVLVHEHGEWRVDS